MRAISLIFLLAGGLLFILPAVREALPFAVPIGRADAASAAPIIFAFGCLLLALTIIRR